MSWNRDRVAGAYEQILPREELLERLINIPAAVEGEKECRHLKPGRKLALIVAAVLGIVLLVGFQNANVAQALRNIPVLGKIFPMYASVEEKVPGNRVISGKSEENTSEALIRLYDKQELGDILQVEYIASKKYLTELSPGFYSYSQNGHAEYYEMQGDKFVRLKSWSRKEKVSALGITGTLCYDVIAYKQKKWIQPMRDDTSHTLHSFHLSSEVINNTTDAAGTEMREKMWIWLSDDRMGEEYAYPVSYHMKEKKAVDVLAKIQVKGVKLSRCKTLSQWLLLDKDKMLVSVAVKKKDKARMYLIDTKKKTAVSVQRQTGLDNIVSAKKAGGEYFLTLTCDTEEGESYDYYKYNPKTGDTTAIYKNFKIWMEGEDFDGHTRVQFSGDRYDFLQDASGIYLVDEVTGDYMTVEGITRELAEGLLPAAGDADYIYCCCLSQDKWAQVGVIDLRNKGFYKIKRDVAPDVSEYSVSQSGNHLCIKGEDEENGKYYYFRYLPK